MGLSVKAQVFLTRAGIKVNACKHCSRNDGIKRKQIGTYGMFNEIPLFRYFINHVDHPGITHADEFVQDCIWNSGPIEWLGLRLSDGTEVRWIKEELSLNPEWSGE
jgi:hypothetical protein